MTSVPTGIPQESPISPIIFLLYVKPYFDKLEKLNQKVKCPRYVEDLRLVEIGRNAETNCQALQEMAITDFECGAENAVMFDNLKSKLIHYNCRRKLNTSPKADVKLPNGTTVKPCETQNS